MVKTGIGYSYKWRNNLVEKALCELGTDQHEIWLCIEKKGGSFVDYTGSQIFMKQTVMLCDGLSLSFSLNTQRQLSASLTNSKH